MTATDPPRWTISRRSLLTGSLAGGAILIGSSVVDLTRGAAGATLPDLDQITVSDAHEVVPFEGVHQAGIVTAQPEAAIFAALDCMISGKAELADALRTVTAKVRFLTAGGAPPVVPRDMPASDSGVLGPTVLPDALTVTLGVGSSLFDDRFGLASRKPASLVKMPVFPNDEIDPAQAHGDLLLQICAHSPDTCLHALREILRATAGTLAVRWKIDGFKPPSKEQAGGTTRNLLAFKDGTANPLRDDPAQADSLVFSTALEAPWASGGSFQVIRIIRMLVEFWDRVSLDEQEMMIGRRRDTGAPLDGNGEFAIPDYGADPTGNVVPLTAHIRLANPRTTMTDPQRILRRSFNYSRSIDSAGNLDMGLIFTAFCADVHLQFEKVQGRLNGEPLEDYIKPIGGGYFFALPGVQSGDDWLGSGLLA